MRNLLGYSLVLAGIVYSSCSSSRPDYEERDRACRKAVYGLNCGRKRYL